MNQKNEEMEQKLNAVKEMYERRPVVLTAVSPGKGNSEDWKNCAVIEELRYFTIQW